jgi:NAD(P)H-nitrite reductase large subunit
MATDRLFGHYGSTEGADDILRTEHGNARRSIYLRNGRIIGVQLAGDIAAAGVYHSLMLRGADVRDYGAELAAPSFGYVTIVAKALSPASIAV